MVKLVVLLLIDGTSGQWSMVGKQHSQLCRISKGGAQCRIALWFSCKIWWPELFLKCGDTFADVFLKIGLWSGFLVFFFLLKTAFWGRHECICVFWQAKKLKKKRVDEDVHGVPLSGRSRWPAISRRTSGAERRCLPRGGAVSSRGSLHGVPSLSARTTGRMSFSVSQLDVNIHYVESWVRNQWTGSVVAVFFFGRRSFCVSCCEVNIHCLEGCDELFGRWGRLI